MVFGVKGKGLRIAFWLAILFSVTSPLAAQTIAWERIEDPNIRIAQFDLLMGNVFSAITHLKADQKLGRITRNPAQAEFVLGGMHLAYGAHHKAAEIFQRLGESRQPQQLRDLAWYQLAQLKFQRGQDDAAVSALDQIVGDLPGESQQERLLLTAMLFMRKERHDDAIGYLNQLGKKSLLQQLSEKSVWATYGRFNLGIALYRQGQEQKGQQLLDELGLMDVKDEEGLALRDKANLTLAYFFLSKNENQKAQAYFERTRLDGPMSNKALLGLGRAFSAEEKHKKSLSPWLKLIKRDASDPAVQDAFLAVPYAFGQLNAFKQALDYYQLAMASFKNEMEQVKAAEATINSGVLVDNLARAFDRDGADKQAMLSELPDSEGNRYLWLLFTTHEFQETLRNYAQVRLSLGRLEEWSSQIDDNKDLSASQRRELEIRIVHLQSELVSLIDRLRTHIKDLALNELASRKKRLASYAGEAQFSMAQIYDYAAKRWGE